MSWDQADFDFAFINDGREQVAPELLPGLSPKLPKVVMDQAIQDIEEESSFASSLSSELSPNPSKHSGTKSPVKRSRQNS